MRPKYQSKLLYGHKIDSKPAFVTRYNETTGEKYQKEQGLTLSINGQDFTDDQLQILKKRGLYRLGETAMIYDNGWGVTQRVLAFCVATATTPNCFEDLDLAKYLNIEKDLDLKFAADGFPGGGSWHLHLGGPFI